MNNSPSGAGRIRVALLYGGRSGEHEISLRSAASVMRNLDPERFEIIPVGIDRDGTWHLNDPDLLRQEDAESLRVITGGVPVALPPYNRDGGTALMPLAGGMHRGIDVVFPVMHGPLCEDGAIQGLCELADVPYVGCGVLASAVGMDKDVAKRLVAAAGLPIVPYLALKHGKWGSERGRDDGESLSAWVGEHLGYPAFVKPANMGSSVGIHKVNSPGELAPALDDAFRYDRKVLIERGVDAREIEFALLEQDAPDGEPLVSVAGEIAPSHEFYSYEAKYLDENGAALIIPAALTDEQAATGAELARRIFLCLECEGMARVDLFLDRASNSFYFNEVNTLPGFTAISMYPKLWEASGISYRDLLTRLIELALARHGRSSALVR